MPSLQDKITRYRLWYFVAIIIVLLVGLVGYLGILLLLIFLGLASVVGIGYLQLMLGGISAASALSSAVAAFFIYKGNKLARLAMVQPRIFVYGSTRDARQRIGVGEHRLHFTHIDKGGVFVRNIGRGPAVKGTLYVIDEDGKEIPIIGKNEKYTFRVIPDGEIYHYPSWDSRELEKYMEKYTLLSKPIRIRVRYFDINNVQYSTLRDEELVDLFPQES